MTGYGRQFTQETVKQAQRQLINPVGHSKLPTLATVTTVGHSKLPTFATVTTVLVSVLPFYSMHGINMVVSFVYYNLLQFDKPSIMKRYHRRRTCSHTSLRRSPTMVTLHDTRFLECRWWNDGWTVKNCRHLTVVGLHDTGPRW